MFTKKVKGAILGGALIASSALQAIDFNESFDGFWYQKSVDSGRGWGIDYIKSGPEKGMVFVAGYVYDSNGNPIWVTGLDTEVLAGESILEFDLLAFTGGNFEGASPNRANTVFGKIKMDAQDCGNIAVDITDINSNLVTQSSLSFVLNPFDEIAGELRSVADCPFQKKFEGCPSFATAANQPKTCIVNGTLTGDVTFSNDANWVLSGGVFVGEDGGATGNLTIEPGTRVLGVSGNDFLAVQRGSKIFAEGTATAPIVFTGPHNASSAQAGAGNWGGLVINGQAPINICDDSVPLAQCEDIGEGGSGKFGGDKPFDSSGVLKYVRVQFGGFRINDEDELNGIAFQAVGSGTVIDYVQVHANEDDGIEFFGGTANAKHLVLTNIKDDSLDWTHGWNGSVQHLVVKQNPDAAEDKERGIEADNYEENNDATPRSQPKIANATFIGAKSDGKTTTGMVLRRGTGANFSNVIVTGFEKCLDLDSSATFAAAGTPSNLTGTMTMQNTVIHCDLNFEEEDGDAFTVQSFFENQPGNVATNPALDGIFPTATTPKGLNIDPTVFGAFFDKVDYVGAFKSKSHDWTEGWTEFLD